MNLTSRLLVSVQIGEFAWSAGQLVDSHSEDRQTLDLYLQGRDGRALSGQGAGASLSMTVTLDRYHTAHVKIFSRLALIDRTGLDASVRTKRMSSKRTGGETDFFTQYATVERRTYAKRRPQAISSGGMNNEGDRGGDGDGECVGRSRGIYDDFDDGDRRDYFPENWDDLDIPGVLPMSSPFSPLAFPTSSDGHLREKDFETEHGINSVKEGLAGASWVHGAHGLVLFHCDPQDNKFILGINKGATWSPPLSLLTLGGSKVPFELIDEKIKCAYQLAHSTTQLPGAFKATQLVTLMPCYCVVNCLDEFIEMRQVGAPASDVDIYKDMVDINRLLFPTTQVDFTPSRKKCSIAACSSAGWHRYDLSKGTAVQIRCESSAWSLGTVDLNEIGTTVLLVPKKKSPISTDNKGKYDNPVVQIIEDAYVLHVEVRFSDPSDHSYVNIVVWAPVPDKEGCCHQAALSIRNDTAYPVIIHQTGAINIGKERKVDHRRFLLKIPPGMWKPFGWMDQSFGTSVTVTLDPVFQNRNENNFQDTGSFSYAINQSYSQSQSQSQSELNNVPSCAIDILKIGKCAILYLDNNHNNSNNNDYKSNNRNDRNDRNDYNDQYGYNNDSIDHHYSNRRNDSEAIDLTVIATAGGSVLHLSQNGSLENSCHSHNSRGSPSSTSTHSIHDDRIGRDKDRDKNTKIQRDVTLLFSLKSFGISLIAERPIRREFMSLYMDSIQGQLTHKQQYLTSTELSYNRDRKSGHGQGQGQGRGYGVRDSVHPSKIGSVFISYELEINDMQIDNYSETAIFPVLMHSFNASHRERKKAARRRKRAIRRTENQEQQSRKSDNRDQANSSKSLVKKELGTEDFPFFALSIVQERMKGTSTPIFKYVAVRILEIKLAVDSSTLQLYFCDLHSDLRGESREQSLAGELPVEWVEHFNYLMVTSGYRGRREEVESMDNINVKNKYEYKLNNTLGKLVDITKTLKAAQEGKMYFETLIIHPIKLRLSFLPTPFPRSKHEDILSAEEYRGFKIVRAIAQVDELIVKISSFHLSDTMDSLATLGSRVLAKTLRDLQSHSVQIVGRVFGSLEFIGKPAGLYRNVGEGVKEFFYEVSIIIFMRF